MAHYVKVVDGAIVKHAHDKRAPSSTLANDGGPTWRPYEIEPKPEYNDVTHNVVQSEAIEPQRVVRRWTAQAKSLSDVQSSCIARINREAHRRIVAIAPEYKQRNTLALGRELILTHGPDVRAWPVDAQSLHTAENTIWQDIKAIRQASNVAVAAIKAATDAASALTAANGVKWPGA